MGYGRLGSSESTVGSPEPGSKKRRLVVLAFFSFIFLLASGIAAVALVRTRGRGSGASAPVVGLRPTQAISRTCSKTRYPSLCVSSLVDFPGAVGAGERDLVHISVNMTLRRVGRALSDAASLAAVAMGTRLRAALDDCMELLEDSMDQLSRSLVSVSSASDVRSNDDVLTWLSAALTNQDTCEEGLADVSGPVKEEMTVRMRELMKLVSNCLAIFAETRGDKDFAGVPIQNRRRLMGEAMGGSFPMGEGDFPTWVTGKERKLLQMPVTAIKADIVVSKDGNGSYKTIAEAIKAAPQQSNRRTVIYIKAGRYDENLKVARKKTNLMFIGDGKGKTIIAGAKSILDNITTFHTATFAATGAGFIARDMTFENWAGPAKHQAVALRVGADHAVVYRCNVIGYQDTLYVHSNRQFFRECDIYGTVDFIFGNAAVVFQNCSIYARRPMDLQKNTITAQNRKDPNQNTGISIHNCRILATPDLIANKSIFLSYLGRPWKLYSRTVYMQSYIGDHVHPRGWLEWNATFPVDKLYYGEYMNYGPGGAVGMRVRWPGYRVITAPEEASKFTVAQFISGSQWLPSTGVAFEAGLSL